MNQKKDDVIAVDGLSYVGKSTLARELARMTGYTHVNTGTMYRALARLALQKRIDLLNRVELIALAERTSMDFRTQGDSLRIMINGEDWTDGISDDATISAAPKIAEIPEVRSILTQSQRQFAKGRMIVMEGRDIGSVVFPNARWKFFVTASFEVRARRMFKTLSPEEKTRINPHDENFLEKLRRLDDSDLNRLVAPLRKSDDAIEYDNSDSPSEYEDALLLYYCIQCPEKIQGNFIVYSTKMLERARQFAAQPRMTSGKH